MAPGIDAALPAGVNASRDRAEAEEAAQACMAVVAEHAGRFEYDPDKGRFKGWLRTIVNNQLRAARRRRRPRQAKTGDFEAAESREASPEELFERMWLNEHLRYCLDRMRDEVPDSSFRAFDLYVLEKQPVEQVCKELNISASQLYRIKWRLTQKLDQKMRTLLDGVE